MAASWGLATVVNKWLLADVHPVPLNFLVRVVAASGMLVVTGALTVLHLWPYGFGIDLESFLLIVGSGASTWLVGFTAYTYALRAGRVGIVSPLTNTDPLWTALFSLTIAGAATSAGTVGGMAVTVAGVVLLSRWHGDAAAAYGAPDEIAAEPVARRDETGGGRSAGAASPLAARGDARDGTATVVGLSVLAAAAWGLSPVLVQMAQDSYGAPSAFMMVESQLVGALGLGAWIAWRRRPLCTRRLDAGARRRVVLLLLASGALEVVFAVLFYLIIDELGAVLAMLLSATAPVFGVFAGMVLLKERLSARLALAVALTIGGVFVAAAARLL